MKLTDRVHQVAYGCIIWKKSFSDKKSSGIHSMIRGSKPGALVHHLA